MKSTIDNMSKNELFPAIDLREGVTTPHKHLTGEDLDSTLSLGQRKYSLVYYLCVGDQN